MAQDDIKRPEAESRSATPARGDSPMSPWWIWAPTGLVAALGLGAEIADFHTDAPEWLVELLSLSYEANVPTWYASILLFRCASALGTIARGCEPPMRRRWAALGAIFVYMSLDEAVEIHEYAGGLIEADGLLYFSWVIPAAVVVTLLALLFVPFLRALPHATRLRFILSGAIYVGGALAMELPLGYWTDLHGSDNLGYGLIDWVEETLELCGASLFLMELGRYRHADP